jgi:pimeloyl-ACP methyl ester carboxylesterase
VPVGGGHNEDMASWTMDMNKQVHNFATVVRNDSRLTQGFHLIGYSQGGLIARAYIERYTHLTGFPRVVNFISWCGPHQGVYGVPVLNYYCPDNDLLCRFLASAFDAMLKDRLLAFELQRHLSFAGFWKVRGFDCSSTLMKMATVIIVCCSLLLLSHTHCPRGKRTHLRSAIMHV